MRPLALMLCLSCPGWGQAQQAPAGEQAAASQTAAAYVGSEVCQACHEDIFNAIQKSPHAIVGADKKRGWDGKTCESCHGPGSKHAEGGAAEEIRNPAKLTSPGVDRTCLTCHLNQPTHVGRIESSHARSQIACTSCHSVHAQGGAALVTRKTAAVNTQCAGCHASAWNQFQKPFKHRVPEGAMGCVDCHNPHGSFRPGMLQTFAANEPGCFRCHGEKRGPFTFEHAPVRFEGCGSCHEPHGSTNPRMLARHEVRFVCLECHANRPAQATSKAALGVVPPAFHDLRSPRYQNCTVCHQKVHGSHVDRNLLR
ncbi:MAG TPA: DmsE family decaheme c-type cytochrome [Bryobacteraceae bacterium]|nr:DmsE family decaheme c-type cytochrome [Bryobacteraceae bacterium]